MKKFGILILLICGLNVEAGMFGGGEPPADFNGLEVSLPHGGGPQNISVSQLYSGLEQKDGSMARSWEKEADGKWILKLVVADKMAGKKHEMKLLFEKNGEMAPITRFFAGGEEIPSSMHANFLLPLVEGAKKKAGVTTKKESIAITPPPDLLSGEIAPMFESGRVSVADFMKYLNTIGKAEWQSLRGEIFISFITKAGKRYSIYPDKRTHPDTNKPFYVVQPFDEKNSSLPNDGEKWVTAAIKQSKKN